MAVRMGRAWTDADEQRWQRFEDAADAQQCEATEPDAPLVRDVVAGCIVHTVAVLLCRLRLAAPSARTLSQEIKAATEARTFWDWLGESMVDLPEESEATVETDG